MYVCICGLVTHYSMDIMSPISIAPMSMLHSCQVMNVYTMKFG